MKKAVYSRVDCSRDLALLHRSIRGLERLGEKAQYYDYPAFLQIYESSKSTLTIMEVRASDEGRYIPILKIGACGEEAGAVAAFEAYALALGVAATRRDPNEMRQYTAEQIEKLRKHWRAEQERTQDELREARLRLTAKTR